MLRLRATRQEVVNYTTGSAKIDSSGTLCAGRGCRDRWPSIVKYSFSQKYVRHEGNRDESCDDVQLLWGKTGGLLVLIRRLSQTSR